MTLLVTSGIRIFIDTYSKESNFYRLYSKVLLSGENSLNISHIWMFNWFIHLWMSCKLTTERITSLLYCHNSDLCIQNTKSTSNILSRVKINKWWITDCQTHQHSDCKQIIINNILKYSILYFNSSHKWVYTWHDSKANLEWHFLLPWCHHFENSCLSNGRLKGWKHRGEFSQFIMTWCKKVVDVECIHRQIFKTGVKSNNLLLTTLA